MMHRADPAGWYNGPKCTEANLFLARRGCESSVYDEFWRCYGKGLLVEFLDLVMNGRASEGVWGGGGREREREGNRLMKRAPM